MASAVVGMASTIYERIISFSVALMMAIKVPNFVGCQLLGKSRDKKDKRIHYSEWQKKQLQ